MGKTITAALTGLFVAGCDTTQDVNLEGRDFTVQQTSVPASSRISDTEQIASLVRASGPCLVPRFVAEHEHQVT